MRITPVRQGKGGALAVTSLREGSPLFEAGLRPRDVLLSANGRTLSDPRRPPAAAGHAQGKPHHPGDHARQIAPNSQSGDRELRMRQTTARLIAIPLLALALLCAATLPPADSHAASQGNISMDFKDVDIHVLIKFVSELTGRNFIIDRRVGGRVTIYSPTKITVDEAYKVFESVLAVNGFSIVPSSGGAYKIMPSGNARNEETNHQDLAGHRQEPGRRDGHPDRGPAAFQRRRADQDPAQDHRPQRDHLGLRAHQHPDHHGLLLRHPPGHARGAAGGQELLRAPAQDLQARVRRRPVRGRQPGQTDADPRQGAGEDRQADLRPDPERRAHQHRHRHGRRREHGLHRKHHHHPGRAHAQGQGATSTSSACKTPTPKTPPRCSTASWSAREPPRRNRSWPAT